MTRDEKMKYLASRFDKDADGNIKASISQLINLMDIAMWYEREACALTCVQFGKTLEDNNGENYAEEIRARGDA